MTADERSFRELNAEVAAACDAALLRLIADDGSLEAGLYRACSHSLNSGGKRLRPALFAAALRAFDRDWQPYIEFAAALEMIHTYSLIHDDLPAMDDGELRRGRPTCHKVYGEALAILAGDGLLTHAFTLMCAPLPEIAAARQLAAVQAVGRYAGLAGMVAGQAVDIAAVGQTLDEAQLIYMYERKTGALFAAALLSAAHLCGASKRQIAALTRYAMQAGLAFQIADDILDIRSDAAQLGKSSGSDARNDKNTYAALVGCERAEQAALRAAELAVAELADFGAEARLLREFPLYAAQRWR
ncbi:MAG: polyprenyl synthetase family protein [Bacillota bacterium]|nr:polyprenyl synthetase family protein [Bacillota bacterium]